MVILFLRDMSLFFIGGDGSASYHCRLLFSSPILDNRCLLVVGAGHIYLVAKLWDGVRFIRGQLTSLYTNNSGVRESLGSRRQLTLIQITLLAHNKADLEKSHPIQLLLTGGGIGVRVRAAYEPLSHYGLCTSPMPSSVPSPGH